MHHFPFMLPSKLTQGFETLTALRVSSLVKSDLLAGSYYNAADNTHTAPRIDPDQLRYARESLIAALASWSPDTTLELRFTVSPDLMHKAQGKIDIHLLIRCHAKTEAKAKEAVASRYLALTPLLGAYIPEAGWVPVTTEDELRACIAPFAPSHAVSIHRTREQVVLTAPLKQPSVGFTDNGNFSARGDYNAIEHLFPWLPSHDDWLRLLEALTGQLDPIQIIIRLKSGANAGSENAALFDLVRRCEGFLLGVGTEHLTLRSLIGILRDIYVQRLIELKETGFNVGVFLLATRPIDSSLANVLGRAISGIRHDKGDSSAFLGGFAFGDVPQGEVLAADYFLDTTPFTLAEAACAFRLPAPPSRDIPGLQVKRFRTLLAQFPPANAAGSGAIRLFVNEHQGMSQPVFIDAEDRMRHCFIMGQTGTGKSTLLETMTLQDIRAGQGLAIIDPHGEMVDDILAKIPRERAKDVILFDLLDRERPIGFNIIEWRTIEERDLIIDELYRTLDHVYDMRQTGGPMFEQHFRNMLKLLMGDKPRKGYVPTVLDFIRCYLDEDFRHWLMKTMSDQQVLDFVREMEAARGEACMQNMSPYVTSKFSRFVNDTTLRRIIGQGRSQIDFDEVMNSGRILLVKLGKGRFGSQVSALLANMFVARFKFAAMRRGEMAKESRRDFYLYVDEAHNLPQDNFTELLSEARKYRLGLVLATQYCSQLGDVSGRTGNDLLAAIFGNVGTTILFRTGATDAERLARGLTPYFDQLDILGLPNFHGYTRMNLNREAIAPFSFRTERDKSPEDAELGEYIRALSQLKYGRDVKIVDAEIRRRTNVKQLEASGSGPSGPASSQDAADVQAGDAPWSGKPEPAFVNLIVLDLAIKDLHLSPMTRKCLEFMEIRTIGDLVRWTRCAVTCEIGAAGDFVREVDEMLFALGVCMQEPLSVQEVPESALP